MGFEPTTFCLGNKDSATELRPHLPRWTTLTVRLGTTPGRTDLPRASTTVHFTTDRSLSTG